MHACTRTNLVDDEGVCPSSQQPLDDSFKAPLHCVMQRRVALLVNNCKKTHTVRNTSQRRIALVQNALNEQKVLHIATHFSSIQGTNAAKAGRVRKLFRVVHNTDSNFFSKGNAYLVLLIGDEGNVSSARLSVTLVLLQGAW